MKRLWLPVVVGLLTAVVGCSADPPGSTPGTDDGTQLSPSVIAEMEALIQEKAARTHVQRKISSDLLYARSGRFAASFAPAASKRADDQITSLHQLDSKGRVLVDIMVRGNMPATSDAIANNGGQVVSAGRLTARAWLALDKLENVAADPSVMTVRAALQAMTFRANKPGDDPKFRVGSYAERVAAMQAAQRAWAGPRSLPSQVTTAEAPQARVTDGKGDPGGPSPTGPVATNVGARTSEGDKAHAADRARHFFGVDGTGVKVGVLSDSDDFKEAAIATGDLPANTTTVPGQDGRPGSGEGTAMMEIVHDVAPGADLFFATAFTSPESFADNIRTLRFQFHCDVILDDIIYFFESPYEDDIIAQAVIDVTNDGALYFSSAGNEGNVDDGTSGTWEGDFKASGALATLPSGYTVHTFGSGVIADRIEKTGGPLILHWADPSSLANPASTNDYDLFLLDNDLRHVVLAATDIQDGTNIPFEHLDFNIPPGFRVVVAAKAGAEVRAIRTVIFRGELGIATPGVTYGHSTTADAYGVAAVNAAEALGGEFTAGVTTPVEIFSSDGPRRIFYDRNNNPIVPSAPGGTFASRAGESRAKPDISAADGVSTTLPAGSGLNPFFGTSAAAPHAGAIAALVKQATPTATPAKIRSAIVAGALDIESPGVDRNAGRGIISAFNTLQKVGAKPAVFLVEGPVTVTPLGNTVVLPGGTAQVKVEIDNLGGAPATAVSSTLTSSSPDVLILQGSSAYPNIPAGGSATNTTLFAFFVNPSAPCGALLPFALTVNYTGNGPHPVVFTFQVQTGRASTTPTHFAYTGPVVAIPDADDAGVDVTLPVSFTGNIAKVVFNIDGSTCTSLEQATTVGVDHTWVGDLTFQLISPSGRSATVIDAAGSTGNSGNNFCQTVLDDAATRSIESVLVDEAPFTGTFSPLQPLSVFTGDGAAGNWTLHVTDNAFLDSGNVRAFSIDVSGFSCTP